MRFSLLILTLAMLTGCGERVSVEQHQQLQNEKLAAEEELTAARSKLESLQNELDELKSQADNLQSASDDLERAVRQASYTDWEYVMPDVRRAQNDISSSTSLLKMELNDLEMSLQN